VGVIAPYRLGDVKDRAEILAHVIRMNIVENGILVYNLQLIVRAQDQDMRAVFALPLRERRGPGRFTFLPLSDPVDPYNSEPDAASRSREEPG
jgi:hypothetical protein